MLRSILILSLASVALGMGVYPLQTPNITPFGIVANPIHCGGPPGTLKELRVTDCTNQPCSFIPGNNYIFEMTFTANEPNTHMHMITHVILGGVPYEIINQNLDQETEPGSDYRIAMPITVSAELSGEQFDIRTQVRGHPGLDLEFCAQISARVI